MSEKLPQLQFQSAEKEHRLEKENFNIRVHRFIKDPVTVLAELRDEAIDYAEEDEDFELSVAEYAIQMTEDFVEFIHEQDIDVSHPLLSEYCNNGAYTKRGDTALFTMLKAAGFFAIEIQTWLEAGLEHIPQEDKEMIESSKQTLKNVYGTK